MEQETKVGGRRSGSVGAMATTAACAGHGLRDVKAILEGAFCGGAEQMAGAAPELRACDATSSSRSRSRETEMNYLNRMTTMKSSLS